MRILSIIIITLFFFLPSWGQAREKVIHLGRVRQGVWSLKPRHSCGMSLEEGILNLFIRSRGRLFSYNEDRIRIRDLNKHGHGFTLSSHHPRGSLQWRKGFLHWDTRGMTLISH